ncbi:MAG: rhodanese-like domain-containing protein [Candidatus Rokuibacteriota bacterium]
MRAARIVLAALLLAAPTEARAEAPKSIGPDELRAKLAEGTKVLIIDVREPADAADGSLPGALNIPLARLQERMKDIPKDVTLVFT